MTVSSKVLRKFPQEFADLLSARGNAILSGRLEAMSIQAGGGSIAIIRDALHKNYATACYRLLQRRMAPTLARLSSPIPRNAVAQIMETGGDLLPKTMRFWTSYLARRDSRARVAAEDLGLIDLMKSESLREFTAAVTRVRLTPRPDVQLIAYDRGDYSGPHTDHHPDIESAKSGYVDTHLTFAEPGMSQSLVYEFRGHFQNCAEVADSGLITVYRLPFWHYTTPLLAHTASARARRWLLLASFDINRRGSIKS